MSAVPFGFVRGCGCGCAEGGSPTGVDPVGASAQADDDAVIDALAADQGVCAAGAGVQVTSATAAAKKNHAVGEEEISRSQSAEDRLPDDVAAPRCAVDTGHSGGRNRQVCAPLRLVPTRSITIRSCEVDMKSTLPSPPFAGPEFLSQSIWRCEITPSIAALAKGHAFRFQT